MQYLIEDAWSRISYFFEDLKSRVVDFYGRSPQLAMTILAVSCAVLLITGTYGVKALSSPKESGRTENNTSSQSTSPDTALESRSPAETNTHSEWYTVIEVVDGDTIKVDHDGATTSVRLIGIDTPETKDPRTSIECYGLEATAEMKRLVQGKRIRLESDSTQGDLDKYSRLLRYAFLENGQNVGLEMIKGGYAKEYTYSSTYRYQADFKAAERQASTSGTGSWAPSSCAGRASANTTDSAHVTTEQAQGALVSREGCDSNYLPCVPVSSADLDCDDIGFSVQIIGTDIHRFDNDNDGKGCDRY